MVVKHSVDGTLIKPPILQAFECLDLANGIKPVWLVWCPWCGELHRHGATPGGRVAHCSMYSGSPYIKTGYVLEFAGTVKTRRDARPNRAPLEGFHAANLQAVPDIRLAILQSWFPDGSFDGVFRSDLPTGGLVSVCLESAEWIYYSCVKAKPDLKELQGQGLNALAEVVFGMPSDVVSGRIGMAITGRAPQDFDLSSAGRIMDAQRRYMHAVERSKVANVTPDQLCSLMLTFIDLDNSLIRTPVERVGQWHEFLDLIGGLQLRPKPLYVVED